MSTLDPRKKLVDLLRNEILDTRLVVHNIVTEYLIMDLINQSHHSEKIEELSKLG